MPVYDYDCPACGHSFEVTKGWNDDPAAQCGKCGADARKRFSAPAIIYKGSGFYTTDYKGKSSAGSPKPQPKKDTPKSDSPATGGETKGKSGGDAPKKD